MKEDSKRQKDGAANKTSGPVKRIRMACEYCRRQKTRCFREPGSTSCMRCSFINEVCSFENESKILSAPSNGGPVIPTTFQLGSDMRGDKVDMLQKSINEVLSILRRVDKMGPSQSHLHALLQSQPDIQLSRPSVSQPAGSKSQLQFFENGGAANGQYKVDDGITPPNMIDHDKSRVNSENEVPGKNPDDNSTFQTPTNSYDASPFSIIANQIPPSNVPSPILDLLGLNFQAESKTNPKRSRFNDVISKGIISETDAVVLMNDFRRNYGRWISFPLNISSSILIDRIRYKSSLLLTTCYCLAMRYSLNGIVDPVVLAHKKEIHKKLIKQLTKEMGKSLMKFTCFSGVESGHIEFLQALVLLSIYALSLSSMARNALGRQSDNPLVIDEEHDDVGDDEDDDDIIDILKLDPWLLSGLGLKMFVTKSTFGSLLRGSTKKPNSTQQQQVSPLDGTHVQSPFTIFYDELDSEEFQKLTVLRTYNHLTLVHLINCIFSGRMCVVDDIRLNYSTATLSLLSSTNFDGRMVSEIGISVIAYNYIQESLSNNSKSGSGGDSSSNEKYCEALFRQVKEEIRAWYEQWEYLFSQPAPQFVELCYHFCCMMIYYAYTYQKTCINVKNPNQRDQDAESNSQSHYNYVSDLYAENNVVFLLKNADDNSLRKILMHAISLVRFINVIESDSYFAYLSDQIHFCFFFAGILILRISEENNSRTDLRNRNPLSKRETLEIQDDLGLVIRKFRMMSSSTNSPDDLTTRYCKGLEELFSRVYKNT